MLDPLSPPGARAHAYAVEAISAAASTKMASQFKRKSKSPPPISVRFRFILPRCPSAGCAPIVRAPSEKWTSGGRVREPS